jgi:hypothetical protein
MVDLLGSGFVIGPDHDLGHEPEGDELDADDDEEDG